jgi:hypothetical protein
MSGLALLTGKTDDELAQEAAERLLAGRGVEYSGELERILALPRRPLDLAYGKQVADMITARYCTRDDRGNRIGTMDLLPIQGLALANAYEAGGLFAMLGVGRGKTLISLFAPLLIGCAKPMLLVPAALREKTHRDVSRYKKHFKLGNVYVESYEKISHIGGVGLLDAFEPDILILDECQRARRQSTAVGKRIRRYIHDHPNVRVIALSGTVANRSLKDFAHILEWCFRSRSPVPQKFLVVEEWASAIDVKISAWGGLGRLGPGALVKLWAPEDHKTAVLDPVAASRNAIRRRMVETNGVVSTTDPGIDTALWVDIKYKAPGQAALDAIKLLKAKEETPCGYALATPLERWRHELTMQVGYYQLWDPEAPKDWLIARSRWAACVRHALTHMQKLDSELSVANALESEKHPITISVTKTIGDREVVIDGLEALLEWRAIRDTFVPNPVPTWIDDTYLKAAEAWAKESPGIIWTSQVAFAEELARRTGLPYYGDKGGRNALTGKFLEPDESGSGSVIASIQSCRNGLNLQAFSRNLVPCPITVGEWTEQMIGRTHRQGQEADEVSFEYWLGCYGAYKAMWQCFEDARFALTTTGNKQRLLFADTVGLTYADLDDEVKE